MEKYTVRLDGQGGITYTPRLYGCDECGWTDYDLSFFTLQGKNLYCSLHKEKGN